MYEFSLLWRTVDPAWRTVVPAWRTVGPGFRWRMNLVRDIHFQVIK